MNWFWKLFHIHLHYFVINELDNDRNKGQYWSYKRRFWHFYKVYPDGMERNLGEFHLEIPVRKSPKDNWFAVRFHIGNSGSETPWDGHLTLFGISWYWGHTWFRKLADRLTRCSGYKYDTRNWMLSFHGGSVYWEIAEHSDMCDKHRMQYSAAYGAYPKKSKKLRRRRTIRRGSANLSIADAIWGPKRYAYEDLNEYQTTIELEEAYPVVIKLQKCYFGRTKVPRRKHAVSYTLDVDAPKGIPTHVDHSGGWKGDRTYGFNVSFPRGLETGWHIDARSAVTAWVLEYRAKSGFREPDPVDQ